MLIGSSAFQAVISYYRLLWISGRFGGHKTSMAYKLFQPFGDMGYKLISNNPSIWGDPLDSLVLQDDGRGGHVLKAFVLLDEGGQYLKSTRQIEAIFAYARKMDLILCSPSFIPPSRTAQVLTLQPIFSLIGAGIPVIVYKWRVKMGAFSENGSFIWAFPQEIYGIYDSADPGDSADKIVQVLIERTKDFREKFGYKRGDDLIPNLENAVSEGDIITEAAGAFEDAAEAIISLPRGGRRK